VVLFLGRLTIETLEQIKEAIKDEINLLFNEEFDLYEYTVIRYKDKNILLFIDNLETLLRDSEQIFSEFNNNLPLNWKVLVTSRVSITNSYLIPLKTLKKPSAIHLARSYINRTIGNDIDECVIENVVKQAHYNPLAIRLTIDLYNAGKEIPESIHIANKEIADFSYNNLIETISNNGVLVLETLFIQDGLTRHGLCEFLQKDLDDITEAINELNRTSLVIRVQNNEDSEEYKLNSSVKDLLLKSPRNIKCRKAVQEKIAKQKTLANQVEKTQLTQGIDEYHRYYIPSLSNPSLTVLIGELYKVLQQKNYNNSKIVEQYNKFDDSKHLYNKEAIFHRGMAFIYREMNDISNAVQSFKKSINLNKADSSTKLMLAILFRKNNDFKNAKDILNELIHEKKWEENYNFGQIVFSEYFRTLLYNHDYEKVLKHTENWETAKLYTKVLGCYRASAWKRKVELTIDTDHDTTVEAMSMAVKTMNLVIENHGYFESACAETSKIFDQIEICLLKPEYREYSPDIYGWLTFIETHILNIVNSRYKYYKEDAEHTIHLLRKKDISNNIFNSKRWNEYLKLTFEFSIDIHEAEKYHYVICTIYNIPVYTGGGYSRNLFAKDIDLNQYYINEDKFKGSIDEWKRLKIDMRLAIKPEVDSSGKIGKTPPVIEALVIDE